MTKAALVDADDLWHEDQIPDLILPIKEAVPSFRITLYGIPNLLGEVYELRKKYPWIVFGIHGFEHTFAECRSWTEELAAARIALAMDMGYHRVFKPPQWIVDVETEKACKGLGVVLHHHEDYEPQTEGLVSYPSDKFEEHAFIHTHIVRNPSTDYIEGHPQFQPTYLNKFEKFLSPLDLVKA